MSLPFDIIGSHSGKTDRREWSDVNTWLHPGDHIALVSDDDIDGLEANARDAARFRALEKMLATALEHIDSRGAKAVGPVQLELHNNNSLADLADLLISEEQKPHESINKPK